MVWVSFGVWATWVYRGLYASSCAIPVYVAGQRSSRPGLMLGSLVMSSHDGTRGGCRSLLFRSVISFLLSCNDALALWRTTYTWKHGGGAPSPLGGRPVWTWLHSTSRGVQIYKNISRTSAVSSISGQCSSSQAALLVPVIYYVGEFFPNGRVSL